MNNSFEEQSNNSTVFLLQEPTSDKDLSSAAKYGRLEPIIASHDKPSQEIQKTMNKLYFALERFNPATDYICIAGGDPIVPFLAGVAMERIGFESVKHLVWNRERAPEGGKTGAGFYVPRSIPIFSNLD